MRVHAPGLAKLNKEYPLPSMLAALALYYLAPLTTTLLAIPATLLCLYRVIRYDAKVYATDYCILAPILALSKTVLDVPLLLYLSLFAAIWYFVRRGFRAEPPYVVLLVLMNYLILRMQLDINAFVLCFGQMFTLCILLPEQDGDSAERAVKGFCLNLLVSSVYAWIFRRNGGIRQITGAEIVAISGLSAIRFKGLAADPNYYMTLLTTGLAVTLKLKDSRRIGKRSFVIFLAGLSLFGILTYSKTFFLMFVLLVLIYVVWQFWNHKVLRGVGLTILAAVALVVLFTMENSPFAVVLERLRSARSLSDLTTSRTDLYVLYLKEITSDAFSFFFGKGLAAEGLARDPHNLYIEIAYYLGVVGLILFVAFYGAMVLMTERRSRSVGRQNMIAKYEVLLVVLALYFTLHGIFGPVFHSVFFVAFASILIVRKPSKTVEKGQLSKVRR